MKLCNPGRNPADVLENMADIVAFLGEAACGTRESAFSQTAVCGMKSVFLALEEDLEELRRDIAQRLP